MKMLNKGGFILYHTFLEGCDKVGNMSPKKPRFILKNGELSSIFSEKNGFKICTDTLTYLSDQRPISYFVAYKI